MSAEATSRPIDGYVDPNFPNPNGGWDTPVIIYGYTPDFSLAVFAVVWFFLFLFVHLFQTIRYRSWYFITFPIGLLLEIVGYIARTLSAKKDPYNLLYFILNYFFIVTAPVFLAAGIYTILSALMPRLGRQYSFLPPRAILWFFITSDVIATIAQVAGAALIGVRESNREDPTDANNILLGGLAYQVFSLGVFVILSASFLFRARHEIKRPGKGLTGFAISFSVATILVYVRTCFRLAETAEGVGGYLSSHEIYFACLEFAPIAAAVLLLAAWAPGRCVGRKVRSPIPSPAHSSYNQLHIFCFRHSPTMPPLPSSTSHLPRIVTYYQTHHDSAGNPISVLPLITQPGIALTHIIVAAIHINEHPDKITLNNDHPSHPRFQTLWAEMRVLQASGIKVLGMLGGAAKGSYQRLDGDESQFERYYRPVRDMIREHGLDGLDLDVEEEMSLNGIVRLIDRLRTDFGPDFIITLAPVAMALLDFTKNLSGFDYEALEVMRGRDIAWYNTQFYCGWGDVRTPLMYDYMIRKGWPPEKVVVGLVTSPANGAGFVHWNPLGMVLTTLLGRYSKFGGVMGWEYFNSMPGGNERPWEWAKEMTTLMRGPLLTQTAAPAVNATTKPKEEVPLKKDEIDPDTPGGKDTQVPSQFDYYTDSSDDE
ncbi:glycoside hydrolase superfamily [Ilyonectria robusta]|uniref:glycoside hydrolase superfamily n=1 Tax=Ilyonectria robusta TaxID=1079257 RepID=UPI001E8CBE07|nr:glycoside hydrolase superfamily [Ilyonectria robusta]KAH8733803.1 glycoside hydrolase superfamily [Ilyonectria robusta]